MLSPLLKLLILPSHLIPSFPLTPHQHPPSVHISESCLFISCLAATSPTVFVHYLHYCSVTSQPLCLSDVICCYSTIALSLICLLWSFSNPVHPVHVHRRLNKVSFDCVFLSFIPTKNVITSSWHLCPVLCPDVFHLRYMYWPHNALPHIQVVFAQGECRCSTHTAVQALLRSRPQTNISIKVQFGSKHVRLYLAINRKRCGKVWR